MTTRKLLLSVCGVFALSVAGWASFDSTQHASAASSRSESKPAVKFAFDSATPQVEKIPAILATEDLKAQGYPVTVTYLQSPADAVQAVASGNADFGSASPSAVFAAIAQGAPVVAVMSDHSPAYEMVAPSSVTGPAGLNGLRVGIHATVSSTALYTDLMLARNPNVKPRILVVPGSANRIQALAAGQLDASAIQMSDLPALEKLAPGKFHSIYNFAQKYSFLMDIVIFVKKSTLQDNRPLVQTVLRALMKEQNAAYTNPQRLANAIATYIPTIDPAAAAADAKTYTSWKIWPTNGGFTKNDIQYTLNALEQFGLLRSPLSIDQCCDMSVVKALTAPKQASATIAGSASSFRPSRGLSAGAFAIVVADRSATDGFRLSGPGVSKSTGAKFRGKVTWKVTLAAGRYSYGSVLHPKLRHTFTVSGKQ